MNKNKKQRSSHKKSSNLFWYALSLLSLIVIFMGYLSIGLGRGRANSVSGPIHAEINDSKENELTFLVVGDVGSGDTHQLEVADAMEERCKTYKKLDGILLLGDNFYQSGVTSTEDSQWQEKFEIPYGTPCLKQATVYPILGNHDYKGNANAQIDYHTKNKRWHMPARNYTVQFDERLLLIAIDSSHPDYCLFDPTCTVNFLRHQLKTPTQNAKHRIVLSHHPILHSSQKPGYAPGIISTRILKPMICNRFATAWLSGHAHHLELLVDPKCPTIFATIGGGGAELYPVKTFPEHPVNFAESTHGFAEMKISQKSLFLALRDQNNNEIHSFTFETP